MIDKCFKLLFIKFSPSTQIFNLLLQESARFVENARQLVIALSAAIRSFALQGAVGAPVALAFRSSLDRAISIAGGAPAAASIPQSAARLPRRTLWRVSASAFDV